LSVKSFNTLVKRLFTPYCALVISSAALATRSEFFNLPTPNVLAFAAPATLAAPIDRSPNT